MRSAWYWKLAYALFPEWEFLHLRAEAERNHPDKEAKIRDITERFIGNYKTGIYAARKSFESLGETK